MIDRYYFGKIDRISPEAPIPITNIEKIENKLGGAANLALNINNLIDKNNDSLLLYSILGENEIDNNIYEELCKKNKIKNIIYKIYDRKTTIKNRIYCGNTMISRFDLETIKEIDLEIQNKIMENIDNENKKSKIDCIVISDYNKGVLSDFFCQNIITYCKNYNILTFVDPKIERIERYKECFLIKPNKKEFEKMIDYIINNNNNNNNIHKINNDINQKLNLLINVGSFSYILCTCGEDGMILKSNQIFDNCDIIKHFEKENIQVKDVTGCGDVVFAVLIVEYMKNKNILESTKIANFIGGKSVNTIGTYECSLIDIQEYYNNKNQIKNSSEKLLKKIYFRLNNNSESNFIFNFQINRIKQNYKKIVFTNGCFDIIHLGHLELLKHSKSLGDYLIVGLNSDSSIKRLKGQNRPINNVDYRSDFLSYFDFIDLIIIFDEDTPFNLLEKLRPNVLVKGGDYTVENIIGKEFVDEVIIHPFVKNYSSTNIIKKIKNLEDENKK